LKANLALAIWIILVTMASLMPLDNNGRMMIPHQDKLVHIFMYAIMAYLALKVHWHNNKSISYGLAIILSILYGCLMEYAQLLFSEFRHFDYFDIIANIIGSMMGSLIYYFKRQKGFL
jgi:VanZ family protein